MITNQNLYRVLTLCTLFFIQPSVAETFSYTGQIDTIIIDNGQSFFSGAVVGDDFQGGINVETAEGTLFFSANPEYFFNLDCCDSAGGVETTNDLILDEATAALYNQLLEDSQFSEGDVVDVLHVEADTVVNNDTRIEAGVTFVLFDDAIEEGQTYTFSEEDLNLSIAFVVEESMGAEIFSVYGLVYKNADGDFVPNFLDNCWFATNPGQRDTDGDGFGNACDPDIDNNCVVNFLDFVFYPPAFGSQEGDPNYNINVDFNEDGSVGFLDLHRFIDYFGQAPGPSATECTASQSF